MDYEGQINKKSAVVFAVVIAAIIAGIAAYTSTGGEEEGGGKTIRFGVVQHAVHNTWEDLNAKSAKWYLQDLDSRLKNYDFTITQTRAGYDPATQARQIRRLVDRGADAIMVDHPMDPEALNDAFAYARDHNVPVISTGFAPNTTEVLMHISYGARAAGRSAAQAAVKYLKNEVEPEGTVEGTVFNIQLTLGSAGQRDRGGGFKVVMKEYPNVEVVSLAAKSLRSKAHTLVTNKVAQMGKPDVIYGQNGSCALGAIKGLEEAGIDPSTVYGVCIDGYPGVLKAIRNGNWDLAFDQPCQFYNPLALHYLFEYVKNGKEAIPDVGTTVTTEDLTVKGQKHMGVEIWPKQVWAPAKVLKLSKRSPNLTVDTPWLRTKTVRIDKDIADGQWLWGNIELPGWE